MNIDKNARLIEYIAQYPALHEWLYFNVINIYQGNTSLLTDADNIVNRFTDGSEEREYIFTVAMMRIYDAGTSNINVEELAEVQRFNEWIAENNRQSIFPDWGDDCTISEIEVLGEMPTMSVDNEQATARYMIQIRISYLQETEV